MHSLQRMRLITAACHIIQRQEIKICGHETQSLKKSVTNIVNRSFVKTNFALKEKAVATALRSKKPKSTKDTLTYFVDIKQVKVVGGKGGDGAISFLHLYINEFAGPAGGDGGHGGHVIFQTSGDVKDLHHIRSVQEAEEGGKGLSKDCFGKNAEHLILKVPIGTIIRNLDGKIVADLEEEGMMFIAARGGSGGHGNPYFKSETNQTPMICEYGAEGETNQYVLEVKSMAHLGLIGLPNAGKSTLLRAVSRARPKVASYPFTTLRPYVGMIQYDDYEQVAVADLPGLIENSHKNKGLGVTFLKHAERCKALLFILDITMDEPWNHLEILKHELTQYNPKLIERPMLVIANKIDLPEAEENLRLLSEKIDLPIIPISAKLGTNVASLLKQIRILYDDLCAEETEER
ncbi:mitochondrial ribosome-associated GTPase 2 isoform X2 [Belonocnema kinseyi]|nr:mitochondrial ribosome-associated GTPase 2 isoform X2 [Belonocnema kinseyi]